jgi:hypothetical protein
MCDVRRQLAKLHVTPKLTPGVTPLQKLHEKMSGFYLSDKNTPIIGELACLMNELYGSSKTDNGLQNFFSQYDEDVQFPNLDEGGWMAEVINDTLPDFDLTLFSSWIAKAKNDPALMLLPPMCVPTKQKPLVVKRGVVVGADIATPAIIHELCGDLKDFEFMVESKLTGPISQQSGTTCKHITEGLCKFGDRCNHLVKKQRCLGPKCRFVHGARIESVPTSAPESTCDSKSQSSGSEA